MERQELKSSAFFFEAISKFRTPLMGLATLNVMLLHIFQNFELLGSDVIFYVFESGADLFMLLSGFGLFYSVDKGGSLGSYFKKRFLRIYPEYIIACVASGVLLAKGTVWVIKDLTTLSFWMNASTTYWFIALIVVLYLIYPFIHKFIRKSDTFSIILIAVTVLANLILPFVFVWDYWARVIAFERIPVFFAGAFLAKKIKYDSISIRKERVLYFLIVAMAALILSVRTPAGFYRLVLLPWTVCVAVLAAFVFDRCKKGNVVVKGMELLGKISLQVYLFHGFLMEFLLLKLVPLASNKPLMILITTLQTLLVAVIVKLICDKFRQLLSKPAKKG